MNPTNGLAALVLAIVSLLAVGALAPYGAATTPDSVRYLDVSKHLRDGEGLVVTNFGVGATLVPFTTYAPAYPIAVAPFIVAGEPVERAASRLAVPAMFVSAWVVFLLVADRSRAAGLPVALAWCLCQPAIAVFTYAWSETLAVPSLLVAVLALDRCARAVDAGSRSAAPWLAAATAAVALLVACRYAAWPLAVILPATWISLRERQRWRWDFAAACLTVGGIAAALALRNVRLTGFVSGAPREPATQGLLANVVDFFVALGIQLPDSIVAWAVAAVAGLVASLWTARTPLREATARSPVTLLCALALCVYYGAIVGIRSVRDFDQIDTRFVALAFPLILVLVARVTAGRGRAARAILTAVLVLVACRGFATYSWAVSSRALRGSPKIPLNLELEYANYNRPAVALLAASRGSMERGRYLDAAMMLDRSLEVCEDGYELARALATAYAGIGEAAASLEWTRRCFAEDADRAAEDTVSIGKPFWDDPKLYDAGIEYYEGLLEDLPDAPWLHRNVEALARRVGDLDRAKSARIRAEALE